MSADGPKGAAHPDSAAGFRERSAKPLAPGLYLVATPIGNLEDITLRALRVLGACDVIACEDTRQTAKLLGHFGITTPTISYHLHNEQGRAEELVARLRASARVAVVSDAGMPGIADPGAQIAAEAIAAGISVFPVPGANAALSALVASGLDAEHFAFHGFLPSKQGQRRTVLESLRDTPSADPATQIYYETPHRIVEALEDIVDILGPAQRVVLARELTKLHEEFLRGTASEVLAALRAKTTVRGEMVLLLAAPTRSEATTTTELTLAEEIAALMRTEGLAEMDAVKRAAKSRGLGKSEAYREWQRAKR
jgi:16S rRNA (cytidine1402-2'-O)-methyltransferase